MSISNYIQENRYLIKDLDNYIYLFPFNEPILNYITDDGTLNATASNINENGYEIYCENVSYNSNSNINSRFSFEHTLTLNIYDISLNLLNEFISNEWMVLFKNKMGDTFVLNAEYPVDVTYEINVNNEDTPNSLIITLKSLSNIPIIKLDDNDIQYTTLREKPCSYIYSKIKKLRMLETTKGFISFNDNKINVYMYHNTLKTIDFNDNPISFIDSFNENTYNQSLTFEIPLINYQFYFHYNILEYINNRYYCIIETTDGKYIVGGYKSGMFPSYTIDGNNIIITLTTNTTSNNTLISDFISFNEIEYNHCIGIYNDCIDGLLTYKLIQRIDLDGNPIDEYYALNGYENEYNEYNVIGTYNRFDTIFGIKLTDPTYDCFEQCYINGLPSFITFKKTGETQCYVIESDCDFTYSYDVTIIDVSFNDNTNELCVTSKTMDSTTQIKITTSDGIDRFINVVIGTIGGEEGEYVRIYRWYYNGETYCLDENQPINCESAKTTTDTITSGTCTYYKTELYISPLCDGEYGFYGYGIGDLISCERIYRWVVSNNETDYYCDYKTYTKYAMEYEEYSDDNGLTWIRTDNSRITDIILEEYSEDCGFFFKGTGFEFTWLSPDETDYLIQFTLTDSLLDKNASAHTTTKFDSKYYLHECSISLSTLDVDYKKCYQLSLSDYYNDINSGYLSRYLYTVSKIPDTILLTSMLGMFYDNQMLISIDALSEFDTSNVITMKEMFYNCKNLTSLDLSSFDTSNVIDMDKMFYGCNSLTCLDLSSFDTSSLTTMYGMFFGCGSLTELNLSGWDLSSFDTSSIGNVTRYLFLSSLPKKIYMCGCSSDTISKIRYILEFEGIINLITIITDNCEMECISTNNESDIIYRRDYALKEDAIVKINNSEEVYDFDLYYPIIYIKLNDILTDCSNMFTKSYVLDFIKLPNTSNVTNMNGMFASCIYLTSLDLSSFDTSNVTNMGGMFRYCDKLTSLNLSSFNTSKVTDMGGMFGSCYDLSSLDLSSFNTSNVTDMAGMFGYCWDLTSLDLSNFDTSKVTNMGGMFGECSGLTSLDLNSFNTSAVTDMSEMFYNCKSLTELDLSNFDTSNVTDISWMFYNCSGLTSLDLSNWNLFYVLSTHYLFSHCNNLTSITMNNCDCYTINIVSKELYNANINATIITNTDCNTEYICETPIEFTFSGNIATYKINNLNTYSANTSNSTNNGDGTYTYSNIIRIPLSEKNEFESIMFNDSAIITINSIGCSLFLKDMSYMFNSCNRLTTINLSSIDTHNVTDMNYMFGYCKSLTELDLSSFDTSNVTDMSYMFYYCSGLTSLNLSSFNTSKLTNMKSMFEYCKSLTELDLSSFDTSNVTNISYMFINCESLTELDLSNFNASKVTNMKYMFGYCKSLTELDLSSFDTSNVTNMEYMFRECSGLTSLDLSSFDTSKVTSMYYMFYNCKSLTELDLSNFDTSNVTDMDGMFDGCSSLTTIKVTNCSSDTISKIQEALADERYTSTVSNGIITVTH